MAIITATIPKWEKFNPRSDRANYSWFRLQNDFFHDQAVFALTAAERCIYLFILCECSKKNAATVVLRSEYIGAILGCSAQEIEKNIESLQRSVLMTAECRHEAGEEPSFIPATRRDVRNVRDDTERDEDIAPKLPRGRTRALWEAYREAYFDRYQVDPIRNATVNGQLARILGRLGEEEAPLVAKFYLTHGDSFYVKAMHTVGIFLRDAEKLRTEWKTGRKITGVAARGSELLDHASEQIRMIRAGEL